MSSLYVFIRLASDIALYPLENNGPGTWCLPQEVWDNVVAHLDDTTAKACSLTCKALYYPARALHWRHIDLYPRQTGRGGWPSTLKSVLTENPILHTLVRRLDATLALSDLPYVASFEHLIHLGLVRLRHLGHDPRLWTLRLSNITELILFCYQPENVSDFIWLLSCFPRLTLLYVSEEPRYPQQLWEWHGEGALSLPYLSEVIFDSLALAKALPLITRAAGISLRRLEMRLPVLPHPLPDILDLSQNTHLTQLAIQLYYDMSLDERWDEHPVAALLTHVGALHTSLTQVDLGLPEMDGEIEPGAALGRELSRVMDDLPSVTVIFHHGRMEARAWRQAYTDHLPRAFPGLLAHTQRIRSFADYLEGDPDESEPLLLCSSDE